VNTSSTSTNPNRRIRRIAGRIALSAVAAGIIGAGPLAASASADCPVNLPACPSSPVGGDTFGPVDRPDFSSIDPDIFDSLVDDGNDGPVVTRPPIDPDLFEDPLLDPNGEPDGPLTPIDPIDPGIFEDPILDPNGDPTDPTTDPNGTTTTTTTTTTVPEAEVEGEQATPVADESPAGELAFTGGGTTLALIGAGVAGIGALAVTGAAVARRRQQQS
jgi:hypothetical protein